MNYNFYCTLNGNITNCGYFQIMMGLSCQVWRHAIKNIFGCSSLSGFRRSCYYLNGEGYGSKLYTGCPIHPYNWTPHQLFLVVFYLRFTKPVRPVFHFLCYKVSNHRFNVVAIFLLPIFISFTGISWSFLIEPLFPSY